jgi:hypothetical protein
VHITYRGIAESLQNFKRNISRKCLVGGLIHRSEDDIVQCWGHLTTSDHQLYRVTPLKTSFGLIIPLLQSQPQVTTFTHNYFLRCYTCTQLTIIRVRDYNHLSHSYTFTLADFSAINYWLKSSHTIHLHTSRVCVLSRPHS